MAVQGTPDEGASDRFSSETRRGPRSHPGASPATRGQSGQSLARPQLAFLRRRTRSVAELDVLEAFGHLLREGGRQGCVKQVGVVLLTLLGHPAQKVHQTLPLPV